MEEEKKLKSLEQHNAISYSYFIQATTYPKLNGIACPKCGGELMDSNNCLLPSYPAQKNVNCSKCDYRGFALA